MSEVDNNDLSETEDNDNVEVIIEDDEGMDGENDSDDDSGNSIIEEEEKEQIVAVIEAKISQNPYVYEDHVELINLLSELGDPHRLSKAYDRLNGWCALEPDQWVHRLHVIRTLAESGSDEENIKKAHEAFEKAIREVYNYQIFMQWCRFVIDLESQETSVNRGLYEPRRVLAKTLDMAGSDPLHGHKFWEKALDYEIKKLTQIESDSPDYEDQVHRVFDVYAGWLSKPLLESDGLLKRFEDFVSIYEFIKEEDIKEVRNDYQTAQELLQKILPFEEKLTMFGTTTKAVSIHIGYINDVNELILLGDQDAIILKNLLPMLYDRASYECCSLSLNSRDENISSLCETLLVDYAEYARRRGVREYFDLVLERIIKRWSKSCRFWIMMMREQERRKDGLNKIKATLETALLSGIPTPEDSVELWLAYLEAIKRHTDFTSDQQLDRLRDTFRLAWDSLGSIWGDRADPSCSILLYWARIEYKIIGDSVRGRDLFEEVFECGTNKSLCNVWLELVNMESRRVPAPSAHKISDIFRRSLKFVEDWPRGICDAWLGHERDHGSVDSLEDCKRVCKDVLDEWEKTIEERRLAKQHDRQALPKRGHKGKSSDAKDVGKKRSNAERDHDKDATAKRARVDTPRKPSSDGRNPRSKFAARGDSNAAESDRKQKQLMPPPPAPGSPPPGYKRPPSVTANLPESTPEADKASRTVFVSNLGYNVNEANLRQALACFGEIADLRVVADVKAFGGSICYCEYVDKSSAQVAISNDRKLLDSRPMFISQYSEERSARRPKFKYSTEAEKNKLFVKNLPFEECTQEKLSEVFAPHGRLRDVRIVTRKDGKPKGLAYVDYEDEESAAKALQATNGLLMGDKEIIVAFSAPPAKSGLSSTSDSTLGGGRRDPASAAKGRGKGRTQLSAFIPRALQTPKQFSEKQGNGVTESTSATGSTSKLSNSDFRNMLLGKK